MYALLLTFLWPALLYVYGSNSFWQAMAYTTISGLFIGGMLYRNHLNQLRRVIIALAFYALAISFTSLTRVAVIEQSLLTEQAFAAHATIIFVTLFYLLGMILGAITSKFGKKRFNGPLN